MYKRQVYVLHGWFHQLFKPAAIVDAFGTAFVVLAGFVPQRVVWLYQDSRLRTTGELWALPVMLRHSVLTVLTLSLIHI